MVNWTIIWQCGGGQRKAMQVKALCTVGHKIVEHRDKRLIVIIIPFVPHNTPMVHLVKEYCSMSVHPCQTHE